MTSGPRTKLKSSAQRAVRAKVCEAFPLLAPSIDAIIPKKEQLDVVKLYSAASPHPHATQLTRSP